METHSSLIPRSCLFTSRWLALTALVLAPSAFADTVRGTEPTLDAALGFIAEASDPVGSGFGLARMEGAVCFRVHDAPAVLSDFLLQRMAATAELTGLAVQEPGCVPNVDVVFTDDAGVTARSLQQQRPQLLQPFGAVPGTTQGAQALNDFLRLPLPVRWWQITVQVDWNGDAAMNLPRNDLVANTANTASRLMQDMRDRLLGSLVLIDIGKLGNTSWDQLADYVAMVSLLQIDPHAQLSGYDSILNLFGNDVPPSARTRWDTAYLAALYGIDTHLYPHAQQGQLANAMLRRLQQDTAPQLASGSR